MGPTCHLSVVRRIAVRPVQAQRLQQAGDAALAAAQRGAAEVQAALDRDRATLAAEAQRLQVGLHPSVFSVALFHVS